MIAQIKHFLALIKLHIKHFCQKSIFIGFWGTWTTWKQNHVNIKFKHLKLYTHVLKIMNT